MALFFKQLQNVNRNVSISLDEGRFLFSICTEEKKQSCRLTKLQFGILTVLFREHPQMVTYKTLKANLQSQKISLVDDTRLHRKVSELRIQLKSFHPMLADMIQNLRGVGYFLAETWAPMPDAYEKEIPQQKVAVSSAHQPPATQLSLETCLEELSKLMAKSIVLTDQGNLTSLNHYCVIERDAFAAELSEIEKKFVSLRTNLMNIFAAHMGSIFQIRLSAALEHFYTYLSLSCISDYMIPHEQWCAWFKQDVQKAYEKITTTVKDIQAFEAKSSAFSHQEVASLG